MLPARGTLAARERKGETLMCVMCEGKEQVTAPTMREACEKILTSPQRTWDEGPAVYVIYREGDVYQFNDLRIPATTFHGFANPSEALHAIAGVIKASGLVDAALETAIGAAFRDEAWMVATTPDDKAGVKYAEALTAERKLSTHPKRKEIRLIAAIAEGAFEFGQIINEDGAEVMWLPDVEGGVREGLSVLAHVLNPAVNPPPS